MKTVDRLAAAIRRICFTPTFRDTRSRSDLYFMEITLLQNDDKFPTMGVGKRAAPAKGLRLVYNKSFVDGLDDTSLHTILCHEAQHLRRQDLSMVQEWLAPRDWYNGWTGADLSNVVADLQINDTLEELGYPTIEGGMYGVPTLGHTTHKMGFEDLMREVASKMPPQQSMQDIQAGEEEKEGGKSTQSGASGESEQNDETSNSLSNGQNDKTLDMHKEAETEKSKNGVSKGGQSRQLEVNGEDVARWGNFLAEIMDTRKQEDSWQRIPKRLAGVDAYHDREYVRPASRPLPRKHALIAIDTSGSMNEYLVKRMLAAVRNSPANYDLQVVTFNHECIPWDNFRSNPSIPNLGGGTDIGPVIAHVQKLYHFPERILVLTDGEFDVPKDVPNRNKWIFSIYGDSVQDFQNQHNLKTVQMEKLLP